MSNLLRYPLNKGATRRVRRRPPWSVSDASAASTQSSSYVGVRPVNGLLHGGVLVFEANGPPP